MSVRCRDDLSSKSNRGIMGKGREGRARESKELLRYFISKCASWLSCTSA